MGLDGQEDESWAVALEVLAGEPSRGSADLIHLWHPVPERMTRRRGNSAGFALYRRYLRCRGDPTAMRSLIAEGGPSHDAHSAAEPPRRDRQPDS